MSLTKPQILDFIKKGQFSDEKIAEYLENETISAEELRNEARLTTDKIDELSLLVHLFRIKHGKYTRQQTIDLVENNIVAKATIEKVLGKETFADYFPSPPPTFNLMEDWENVPPLKPDRIDVFVLGIATSGKSCFMSGLIHYADKAGQLQIDIDNASGFVYANQLIDAVRHGVLPPATPKTAIQYMACDFKGNDGDVHPFSFIEMAGENFERAFGKTVDKIPSKFNEYLFASRNQKIFFLCLDYYKETQGGSFGGPSQKAQFDFILKLMRKHGALETTEAICIVVTKWDTYTGTDSEKGVADFLNSEYKSLIALCKEYEAELKKLVFIIFPFSLGDFTRGGTYRYASESSENIFNWLCDFTSSKNEKGSGKKGWFGR